jgi:acetyl-CoA carboxylase carboxyl transferase subunit alpha
MYILRCHWDYDEAADILKKFLLPVIAELKSIDPQKRCEQRIEKFGKMGFWDELPVDEASEASTQS